MHGAEALAQLGAEHDEARHRQRVRRRCRCAIVVGGTLKLFTMPLSATGSEATLNDMIAWPSAIAIIGTHEFACRSGCRTCGAVVVAHRSPPC